MKKIVLIALLLFTAASVTESWSQGWGERLIKKAGQRLEDRSKQKVEDKVNKAVDNTVDSAFGTAESAVKGTTGGGNSDDLDRDDATAASSSASDGGSGAATAPPKGQSLEMTYAKSDFVPGDEVIFEDYLVGEKLGEFPGQWELHRGNAEIASMNGQNVILMDGKDSWLEPLMKTPKNYLGDIFTLEFDYFQARENTSGSWELDFMGPNDPRDGDVFTVGWYHHCDNSGNKNIAYGWNNNASDRSGGSTDVTPIMGDWNHIAVSFNKRALKIYFNGARIANVPNVSYPPGWVTFWSGQGETGKNTFIRNVRIAKGAVPLYDRMMSDGKFITYGITFDVGKSVIKPESMGEINRIVTLMNENPTLKFSVEGHTDSTGNAASNQTLSEARSKAIVAKFVELGIAADRLSASGKGQNNPIADNSTDEGRAKNRRVEFVKQ